jgi:hypothetical protein
VNDAQERYTVRKAISDCQWTLTYAWLLVAVICVLLALARLPWLFNLVVTVVMGPAATAAAVLGRVRRMRRLGR